MGSFAVANAGIGGNGLLHSALYGGPAECNLSALARFNRDVLALAGVRRIVLLEGSNDLESIGIKINGRLVEKPAPAATVNDLIGGYQQIIALAHQHGIQVIGGTIIPFEGVAAGNGIENAWNPDKQIMRTSINQWIRGSASFDAVVDFDAVMRDPAHPSRLLPLYD